MTRKHMLINKRPHTLIIYSILKFLTMNEFKASKELKIDKNAVKALIFL